MNTNKTQNGTPPDGWSFIKEGELGDDPRSVVQARLESWYPEMTHYRMTDLTGPHERPGLEPGIWVEVWKERPVREAEFSPPLTAA